MLFRSSQSASSTAGTFSTACSRCAVWRITCPAAWLEASHHIRARAFACRGGTLALFNCEASSIVLEALMAARCDHMVGCVAISAACTVDFEFERSWARVFTALDLVTSRSKLRIAKAVFFAIFHIELGFFRALSQQSAAESTASYKVNHEITSHTLHCHQAATLKLQIGRAHV